VATGMIGMALAGLTAEIFARPGTGAAVETHSQRSKNITPAAFRRDELAKLREECKAKNVSLHGALMDKAGWPAIPFDGQLLVSHQDALLMGGKVQAPHGYADHVVFSIPNSAAMRRADLHRGVQRPGDYPGENGVPNFDREKCVHCGACLWNCSQANPEIPSA
jgi:electron-transferring-flavoprotein dehydrogenase